jgi:predicted dehydrogenase
MGMAGKSLTSRREFLKRTALGAMGAIGFPYIIPSSARGADGATPPSNRIAMGFIGMGKLGRESHLEAFKRRDDVHVVAVCDVESTRLEKSKAAVETYYADKFGAGSYRGCDMHHEFEELLARSDIDAVCIATPDHWHAILAIAAAKSGKDIYCEKPMTRYIADGRSVVDAVRRYGRVFQTGSQQRSEYDNYFSRAAELVRAGVIGDLKSIDIGVGGFPIDTYGLPEEPVPPSLDWDRWQGPAPWRPYNSELCPMNYPGFPNWRGYRDYAGGSFSDFGAHHFDIAQWALGMDGSGPVEIIPPDGKDVTRMTFLYANGLPMHHGGEADCVFNGTNGKILVSRHMLTAEPLSILDYRLGVNDVHLCRHRGHRDDFLYCVKTRSMPIADVEIGHRTSTVCQLGNICNFLNRRLKWDPVAEQFVGDEEANRLLYRPDRGEWRV